MHLSVRYAYSSHFVDDAHRIVKRETLKFETQTNLVLYLKGLPSEEKKISHTRRQAIRATALKRAQGSVIQLENRVEKKLHRRDRHLRQKEWFVEEYQTEADLKIGRDFMPDNTVLLRDSDILIHAKISTVVTGLQLCGDRSRKINFSFTML
ncbi:hypothetical protein BGZ54_009556 [Gamsiella multidivaricata]|nr:hypothetical protein BGZ54_009556 [Gamsiella multidivaricata]